MNPTTVKNALKIAAVVLAVAGTIAAKLAMGEQISIDSIWAIVQSAMAG